MDVSKLKQHLECTICLDIPVGINVLVCTRGHDICQNCFEKLNSDSRGKKKCPSGRCAFAVPPVRNRTVESIIEMSTFIKKCPQSVIGCKFRGFGDNLAHHLTLCPLRKVDCIEKLHCQGQFYPKEMMDHLKREHQNVVFSSKLSVQKWLMKSKSHLKESKVTTWNLVVCSEYGQSFGIRFMKQENLWYTWIVQFANEDECKNFVCNISVMSKMPKTMHTYNGCVNSVRLTTEEIIQNGHGLVLTNAMVRSCILGDISENSRDSGFDVQLPVHYSIAPIRTEKADKVMRRSHGNMIFNLN